jgi:ferrochelatase
MMNGEESVGVLLMSYGSPETPADVPSYLTNVYGGRTPDAAIVREFQRRYTLIGGSPLVAITRAQAAELQQELQRRYPQGPVFSAEVGMRFAPPSVAAGLASLAYAGVGRLIGIIMSPQYSPVLMQGYHRAVADGLQRLEYQLPTRIAGPWHRQPRLLDAVAASVRATLARVPAAVRDDVPVLLTAHSMPRRVVVQDPGYVAALEETAAAVAERAGLPPRRWQFCYQSAGHTREEWLRPDIVDLFPELAAAGQRHVLVAPVQFLADHLEILYDLDVAAREQAERHGIGFLLAPALNTAPLLIGALADVVKDELASLPVADAAPPTGAGVARRAQGAPARSGTGGGR